MIISNGNVWPVQLRWNGANGFSIEWCIEKANTMSVSWAYGRKWPEITAGSKGCLTLFTCTKSNSPGSEEAVALIIRRIEILWERGIYSLTWYHWSRPECFTPIPWRHAFDVLWKLLSANGPLDDRVLGERSPMSLWSFQYILHI